MMLFDKIQEKCYKRIKRKEEKKLNSPSKVKHGIIMGQNSLILSKIKQNHK